MALTAFGSGTNRQDMIDSEEQTIQKRGAFMVTITLHCSHCESDALVRNGHAPNGKQLYRCHACGRQSRENPTPHAYPQARREEILSAYQERSSLRGLTRTFGVSRTTVSNWIKKKELSFPLLLRPW
jgi:transposase-like protein